MKALIVLLAALIALGTLAYALNESTTELNQRNATLASSKTPVNVSKVQQPSNFSDQNARCGRQFECRVANLNEKSFWFNCYYDSTDKQCRCYKGDLNSCNISKSSVSLDDWCAYQFECVKSGNLYQFGCYYDTTQKSCRCYKGDLEQCGGEKSLVDKSHLIAQRKPSPPQIKQNKTIVPMIGPSVNETKPSSIVMPPKGFMIGISAVLAIAIIAAIIFGFSSFVEDDLSRARKYHKKAERLHDEGKEEEAHKFYKLAEELRAKARSDS